MTGAQRRQRLRQRPPLHGHGAGLLTGRQERDLGGTMSPAPLNHDCVGLDEEHRRLWQDCGGTYLGLLLAAELSATLPIVVPRHRVLRVDELDDDALATTADHVCRSLASGFVMKY